MVTLVRPAHPASLPAQVFTLKQKGAYLGTHRPVRRESSITRSHIIVFQKQQDARALHKLFMEHRSNLARMPDAINDSWQMTIQKCHEPYEGQLDIEKEELCDLIQMGLDNICINVVQGVRMYGGLLEFNVRAVDSHFELQQIRQHFTDVWDRSPPS